MLIMDSCGKLNVNTDVLNRSDWKLIAAAGARTLPRYGHVVYASMTAKELARAFLPYRTHKHTTVLVVDTIWRPDNHLPRFAATTVKANPHFKEWCGFVAFVTEQTGHRPPQVRCFMQVMTN